MKRPMTIFTRTIFNASSKKSKEVWSAKKTESMCGLNLNVILSRLLGCV